MLIFALSLPRGRHSHSVQKRTKKVKENDEEGRGTERLVQINVVVKEAQQYAQDKDTLRVSLLAVKQQQQQNPTNIRPNPLFCCDYQIFHLLPQENDLLGVRQCLLEDYQKMLQRKSYKKSLNSAVISQQFGKAKRIFVTFASQKSSWLIKPFTFLVLCIL